MLIDNIPNNKIRVESLTKKMNVDKEKIPRYYVGEKLSDAVGAYSNVLKSRDYEDYGGEKVDPIRNPNPSTLHSKDVFSSSGKILSKHVKLNLQVDMTIGDILSTLKSNEDGYVTVNIKNMKNLYVSLLAKKFKQSENFLGSVFRYDSIQGKKIKFGYTSTDWTLIRRSTIESSAKINYKSVNIGNLESKFSDREKIGGDFSLGGYTVELKEEFDGDRLAWVKTTLLKDPTKLHKKKIGWGQNIFDIPLIDDHRVDLYEIYTRTTNTPINYGETVNVIFPISIKLENCFENVEIYKILEKTLFDNYNFFTPLHSQIFRILKSNRGLGTTLVDSLLGIEDSKALKQMNKAQSLYLEYKAALISLCREIKLLYDGFTFKGALSLVRKILGIKNIKTSYIDGKFRKGRDQNQDPIYGIITKEKKFTLIQSYVDISNYEVVSSKLTINSGGIVDQVKLGEDINLNLVDSSTIKKFLSDLNAFMLKLSVLDTGEVYMRNVDEVIADVVNNVIENKEADVEAQVNSVFDVYSNGISAAYNNLSKSIIAMGSGDALQNTIYIAKSFKKEKEMYDVIFKLLNPQSKYLDGNVDMSNTHDASLNAALDAITLEPPSRVEDAYPMFIRKYFIAQFENYTSEDLLKVRMKFSNVTYDFSKEGDSDALMGKIVDAAMRWGAEELIALRPSWSQMENKNTYIKNIQTFFMYQIKSFDSLERQFSSKAEINSIRLNEILDDFKDPSSSFQHLFEKLKNYFTNVQAFPTIFTSGQSIDGIQIEIPSKEIKYGMHLMSNGGVFPLFEKFNRADFIQDKDVDQNVKASGISFLEMRKIEDNDEILNNVNNNMLELNEVKALKKIVDKGDDDLEEDTSLLGIMSEKMSHTTATDKKKKTFTKQKNPKNVINRNYGDITRQNRFADVENPDKQSYLMKSRTRSKMPELKFNK
jgi:hypothetical protein